MSYRLEFTKPAQRQFGKLDGAARRRIAAALELLAEEPHPRGAKKMVGGDGAWRVRTGDYRILYEVNDGVLVVLVLAVGRRRESYRRR